MVIYGHLMVINGLTNNGESWNDMGFPLAICYSLLLKNAMYS